MDIAAERTRIGSDRRFHVGHRVLSAIYAAGLTAQDVQDCLSAVEAAAEGRNEVAAKLAELAELRDWVAVVRP